MASQLPTAGPGQDALPAQAARGTGSVEAPLVLGRYRLGRRLGAGAFGTVWAARDERLEREVAVKMLDRDRIVGGRFEREARVAARLSHPAIVTLYEAAVDDEGVYLVSELVRGTTLSRALRAGKLSDREIVRIGIALCDALTHAHAEGVIHRDVKPANILIPARPSSPAYPAKLTDFGVAHVLEDDALTITGDVIGTAAYMAPEQAEGREIGPEADLYALALVIYESLTGVNPVADRAGTHRGRMYLPPLRRQRRELPRELAVGVDLALRPRPRERGTVGDLRAALRAALPRTGEDRGVVEPWQPPTRRAERDERGRAGTRPRPRTRPRAADDGPPPVRFDTGAGTRSGRRLETDAWPARAAAAACAAATLAWPASLGLLPAATPAAVLALAAAGAVLVLPRLGWLAVLITLAGLLGEAGHGAAMLVLAPALAVPIVLLPRRGTAWPVPAAAVALGLISLGGAWPALAARARTPWRRAVLGASGLVWLIAAGQLTRGELGPRRPPGAPLPERWTHSARLAIDHVLPAEAALGVLAAAAAWGLWAVLLPTLLRAGRGWAQVPLVVLWSVTLISVTSAALGFGGPERGPAGEVQVLGAIAAGIVALVPELLAARSVRRPGGAEPELP